MTYPAIHEDNLDITDAYSTDGDLKTFDLTLLEDDRKFFPSYALPFRSFAVNCDDADQNRSRRTGRHVERGASASLEPEREAGEEESARRRRPIPEKQRTAHGPTADASAVGGGRTIHRLVVFAPVYADSSPVDVFLAAGGHGGGDSAGRRGLPPSDGIARRDVLRGSAPNDPINRSAGVHDSAVRHRPNRRSRPCSFMPCCRFCAIRPPRCSPSTRCSARCRSAWG